MSSIQQQFVPILEAKHKDYKMAPSKTTRQKVVEETLEDIRKQAERSGIQAPENIEKVCSMPTESRNVTYTTYKCRTLLIGSVPRASGKCQNRSQRRVVNIISRQWS